MTVNHTRSWTCSDCAASAEPGQVLRHVWSCPVAVADRAQCADDLRWLRAHPDAQYRTRPASWAEQEYLRLTGFAPAITRRITLLVGLGRPGQRLLLHLVDGVAVAASVDLGGMGP